MKTSHDDPMAALLKQHSSDPLTFIKLAKLRRAKLATQIGKTGSRSPTLDLKNTPMLDSEMGTTPDRDVSKSLITPMSPTHPPGTPLEARLTKQLREDDTDMDLTQHNFHISARVSRIDNDSQRKKYATIESMHETGFAMVPNDDSGNQV